MAVIGFAHVQLAIARGGEAEARQFYRDVLGMEEMPKPSNLSPQGCWFESGPAKLHLGVEPQFHAAKKVHSTLLVDGINALRSRKRRLDSLSTRINCSPAIPDFSLTIPLAIALS